MKLLAKRIAVLIVAAVMLLCLGSCSNLSRNSNMPFNGNVKFHSISITIPNSFVRDTTQSSDDAYVFEKGFYKQMIIITRNDFSGDESDLLNSYVNTMKSRNAESELTSFMGCNTVYSEFRIDNTDCYEILFIYDDSIYAISLRGGSKAEYDALVDSVALNGTENVN